MGIATARELPSELTLDICIIGAGASGLTIASDFLKRSLAIGVLESGGLGDRPEPSLSGEQPGLGLPYASLATSRLKGFGGSTQALGWGGLCKPLDRQDFCARPWVSDSGWPFDADHLKPYYDRARETLGVGDIAGLAQRQHVFPERSSLMSSDNVELCRNYRLGKHLRTPLERSGSVKVFTNVTVLNLEFDESGGAITAAICADAAGKKFRVAARAFILAAGGIENARLLLLSNLAANRDQGLVGRYFMDHPRFTIGTLIPADGNVRRVLAHLDRIRIARKQRVARRLRLDNNSHYVVRGLTLPFEVQEREQLLNHRAWVEPYYVGQNQQDLDNIRLSLLQYRDNSILSGRSSMLDVLLKNMSWTKGMHFIRPLSLVRAFRLHHFMEPEPFAPSAVSLSPHRDHHGLPLVSLSWQLASSTLESLKRTIKIFQDDVARSGLGRLEIAPEEWENLKRPMWTWHHMGTTRMHNDPSRGVVDADCRVHGVRNLFVAGSSVFPTAGNDTPTLTIVALAHRLSDHLLKFVN